MDQATQQTQASTETAPAGTEQSSAAAGSAQSSQSTAAGQSAASTEAPARPDGLPDWAWDATANSVKLPDLLGKFNELSAFKAADESRRLSVPESADKYELKIPEGTEMPEGIEFKLDVADPMFKIAREAAHAAGMDQAGFEANVLKPFIQMKAAAAHQEATQFQEAVAAADKELGAQATARRDAIKTYVAARYGAGQLDWMQHILPVPGFVKFMEQVARNDSSAGMPGFKATGREGGSSNGPSQEDWDKMTPAERLTTSIARGANQARA